jgi:hypothetical protein
MMVKPVRLSAHAAEQARFRGATEEEVAATIRQGEWQPAERERWEVRVAFPFNAERNGADYDIKQVRPIFVEEQDEIVVVIVYRCYYDEEGEG